jgi:hypothetical protein
VLVHTTTFEHTRGTHAKLKYNNARIATDGRPLGSSTDLPRAAFSNDSIIPIVYFSKVDDMKILMTVYMKRIVDAMVDIMAKRSDLVFLSIPSTRVSGSPFIDF